LLGLYYYSADLDGEGKFTDAIAEKADVSWDPQRTNVIWRHRPGGGYESCSLATESAGFADMTLKEAGDLRYSLNKANQRGRLVSAKALHDITQAVEAHLDVIRAHSSNNLSAKSMAGAKAEREHEKIMERLRASIQSAATVDAYVDEMDGNSSRRRRENPFNHPG